MIEPSAGTEQVYVGYQDGLLYNISATPCMSLFLHFFIIYYYFMTIIEMIT